MTLTDQRSRWTNINTTDSAARITHIPTKTVVCVKTKGHNIKIKKPVTRCSRLDYINLNYKKEKRRPKEQAKTDIGWGHQTRSYVLQPYQLVKDLRNKVENTNPTSVLDGNIDQFIEEGIKK